MINAELPLVVSFFTNDWQYPAHGLRLEKECQALGLDYRIEEHASRGGYIENSCIKPFFIRKCLQEEKRPVLWVDVDGSILKPPVFFLDLNYDFQARKINSAHRKRIWHVGTMWFNPTPETMDFVDEWCARTGDMTDESALDQTWKSRQWPLRTRDIPSEYFHILERNRPPLDEVVIAHRLSNGPSKQKQAPIFNRYEEIIG